MPTYIRVKDLPNAATSPAADDFILLSGAANGARRISRADFLAAVAGFYTSDPSTYKLATLDAGNKVLVSQLPSSAFSYQGTWAASTNTPTLANGTGTGGDTYYASDSGSVDFGAGSISFLAGDAVVYDGSVWQKVPDVVNLLDGKGTLDEAKTTLEIPDVGSSPDEVSLNGMLGSMAFQSAEAVSVDKLEVTDKVDGPLGVGATPVSNFHSKSTSGSTTNTTIENTHSANVFANFKSTAASVFIGNKNGSFVAQTSGGGYSDKLIIDSSGNVGIGGSPSDTLSVSSANTGRTGVSVGNTTTGGRTYIIGSVGSATDGGAAAGSFTIRDGNASANRLTIDSSGNATLNSGNLVIGTSGKGIDFGSATSGSGNTVTSGLLSDYEEGDWTPSPSIGSITGTGLTYTGKYTKIGRLVQIYIRVNATAHDINVSSYVGFTGVPFTMNTNASGTVVGEDIDSSAQQGFASISGATLFFGACGNSTAIGLTATLTGYI